MAGLKRLNRNGRDERNDPVDPRELAERALWLASRFDAVSKKYPALRLVALRRPQRKIRVHVWSPSGDESMQKGYRSLEELGPTCFGRPIVEGRFAPDEGVGYHLSPERSHPHPGLGTAFAMPSWEFDTDTSPWANGFWRLWLHRDFGRDPREFTPTPQDPVISLKCMEEYQLILPIAGALGTQLHNRFGLPGWPSVEGITPPQINGVRCDFDALLWCLFLFTQSKHRVESSRQRDMAPGGSPHLLWIIDDIGMSSAEILSWEVRRHMREIESSTQMQKPPALTSVLAANPSSVSAAPAARPSPTSDATTANQLPAIDAATANQSPPSKKTAAKSLATVNDRLTALWLRNRDTISWTSKQFAAAIGATPAAIRKCATWKWIRADQKAEKQRLAAERRERIEQGERWHEAQP